MKKIKKLSKIFFTFLLVLATVFTGGNVNITTESKKVYSNNNGEVSDRELALLASLVYEDVPSRNICKKTKDTRTNTERVAYNAKKGCYFTSKDIVGMTSKKANSLMGKVTQTAAEPGQDYYFYNFADTSEAKDWKIVNFKSEISSLIGKEDNFQWQGRFDAITFQKGHDYVIAFRGTDYPDLLEWLQDINYAKGYNNQSDRAFNYARDEYNEIVNKIDSKARIYVTGHSLGAYLAQVGGAGIVSLGAVKGLDYDKNLTADLKNQYTYSVSKNYVPN